MQETGSTTETRSEGGMPLRSLRSLSLVVCGCVVYRAGLIRAHPSLNAL